MTKPTKEQMNARAWGIAEAHFYSDDECEVPWQPFEDYDSEELLEQVKQLAETIITAMIWAQGEAE
jgi:hypothetical protein